MDFIFGHFNYWVVISLMMLGLYVVISTGNLVKKLVGLGMFQTSVFQLYITMGKVAGGRPPILEELPETTEKTASGHEVQSAVETVVTQAAEVLQQTIPADPLMGIIYSNPLPHVLILTAIVVGVATLAVGLALVVRIREAYGSIEEVDIDEAEYKLEVKAS
ncbi:Na(+) H(+) antiporter subunit C [hydrothermal vent metagenome]|uniref:Na(+) H(+) antiporter subunit C n=1 Tax=hydrothermal vent metagenome TaxID=652676 RepID=A0A3B0T3R2_9ZZZZ